MTRALKGTKIMEDLFRSYWWLLFPLSWFIFGGFSSFLNYRRQKDTLKLIQTYAERGQEPPEALLKVLDRPIDSETEYWRTGTSSNNGAWFSVVLFGLLSLGFGYAAWSDMYGAGEAFVIVSFVLGALCVASLVSAFMGGRDRAPRA
jgi:hypothetical protein